MDCVIEIHERYKVTVPPAWFRPTVERLLESLRPEHVGGLRSVVLTDSAGIGREKTGRVGCRKYDRDKCRGFYYQEWRGQPAWIQLVTDNIIAGCPTFLMRLQLFRDQGVAEVLYHEVGHHLHMTVGSATRGGEEAAESWRKRLSRIHFRRRYWYLRPIVVVLQPLVQFLRRINGGAANTTMQPTLGAHSVSLPMVEARDRLSLIVRPLGGQGASLYGICS